MNQPTELQLQLALAKELPELIERQEKPYPRFFWKGSRRVGVTPREWDRIVRECEKKLTEEQKNAWRCNLFEAKTGKQMDRGIDEFEIMDAFLVVPWPTRAIAYFKTIGKEIEGKRNKQKNNDKRHNTIGIVAALLVTVATCVD